MPQSLDARAANALMPSTRTVIALGVLCVFGLLLLTWGTPDFATTIPPRDALRDVQEDEVFLVSHTKVELEDPSGFRCFFERRPINSNAWNPPVTVLWLTNGEDAVRFSSQGCTGDEVRINDELSHGYNVLVLDDCTVEIDGEAGRGDLLELLGHQEHREGPYAVPAPAKTSIIFHNRCSVVVDDEAQLWLVREDLESLPNGGVTSIAFDEAGTNVLVTDAGCGEGELLVNGEPVKSRSFRVLASGEVAPIAAEEALERSMQHAPR